MAEPFTLYKLIILYMLDRVDFPLTNSQISSFLLDRGYTNYFTLQQAFSELEEANLVKPQTIRNTTQFQLTKSGREALGYFCDRIPNAIQEEADQYLQEHKIELRNEVSVTADYYRTTAKEYAVHCVIKEKESDLIDLTLTVPDKKQAEAMCKSWKNKCEMVYQFLMTQLSATPGCIDDRSTEPFCPAFYSSCSQSRCFLICCSYPLSLGS